MAIPRKKILQKIAGLRKGVRYHLDRHIPDLIGTADADLVEYWRREVSGLIDDMEAWAGRLSSSDTVLAEAREFRSRLATLLDGRLRKLAE